MATERGGRLVSEKKERDQMANQEKDRLGDKLRDAGKGREDDYFARRDRELLEKLKREQNAELENQDKESGEK